MLHEYQIYGWKDGAVDETESSERGYILCSSCVGGCESCVVWTLLRLDSLQVCVCLFLSRSQACSHQGGRIHAPNAVTPDRVASHPSVYSCRTALLNTHATAAFVFTPAGNQCTMTATDSTIGYLGSGGVVSGGLAWRVRGTRLNATHGGDRGVLYHRVISLHAVGCRVSDAFRTFSPSHHENCQR